jgi:hypothetical protein
VESFQATIAGRYWGILRLRESRNKSVVVFLYWDERGFNPGWRLGSQWGVARFKGVQKGLGWRVELGQGFTIHILVHPVESAC